MGPDYHRRVHRTDAPCPAAPTRVDDALAHALARGIDRRDAQTLLADLLGRNRAWLAAHGSEPLAPDAARRWHETVERCASGEPLAYVLGHEDFHGLRLAVGPAVLIPRPDTETLVDWALERLAPDAAAQVLDLGTGSGAIALAAKARRPKAQVSAVDLSAPALAQARDNGQRLGLEVRWLEGRWWQAVPPEARFDLVLSNPPYIAEGDPHLPALAHEPRSALVAGHDGLDDLREIIAHAPPHLLPGAWLLLEHGWDQAEAVQGLLRDRGFQEVSTRTDLGGRARCTGGRWPGHSGFGQAPPAAGPHDV